MRTAYINKENRVVYIAAFAEDKIQADKKGRLLFGGTVYHPETGTASHTLGSGEEVFEVSGEGLGLGDIYTPPLPAEPADPVAALESEVQSMEEKLKLEYLKETIDPAVFDAWVEGKANA